MPGPVDSNRPSISQFVRSVGVVRSPAEDIGNRAGINRKHGRLRHSGASERRYNTFGVAYDQVGVAEEFPIAVLTARTYAD